jgi:hypothetical protein
MTIFNNREYIRDSFLDIVYETHLSKERKLLETVLPQNYPFFCSLFIKGNKTSIDSQGMCCRLGK